VIDRTRTATLPGVSAGASEAFPAAIHRPDAPRRVVLLPGARYPTRAPLLWFSREVAIARGYGVLEVLDEPPAGEVAGGDLFSWARDRALRALEHDPPRELDVVIGKSLSSDIADLAADRALPAVWLTPLLDRPGIVAALARTTRPTLLVGSTADPTWNASAIPDNVMLDRLELDGLDHGLQLPGDPQASLAALRKVVKKLDRFLSALR
jgi:pimeloyl-ACP methyl ester carboxylesterase